MTLGAFVAGFAINRYGRQPVVLAAFVLSIAGTFLQFFSKNLAEFVGGKILTGLVCVFSSSLDFRKLTLLFA